MKKRMLLIIPIIFIIAVITTAIIYYYTYYTKPEQTYIRLIGNIFNNSKFLENINYDTYVCDTNMSINVQDNSNKLNKNVLDIINNSNANMKTQINKKEKQLFIDFRTNYNDNELLKLKTCTDINKKETYVCLKEFLNKYFEIEINDKYYDFLEKLAKINKENSNIEILESKLIDLIKEGDCSSNTEKILLKDKVKKIKKDTIKIKGENLLEILKIVHENPESNDIISKYKEAEIEINVYTIGILKNKVKKVNITINNAEEIINLIIEDNICYYEYVNQGETFKGNISFENQTKNNGSLKIVLNTEESINATLKLDYTIDYNTNLELLNITNSTEINGLTKEEQIIFLDNFKKSNLYSVIKSIIN